MLVLSRKIGEVVTIGNNIKVTVLNFDRGIVRLGIEAPANVPVHRKEIHDKIAEMNQQAASTDLNALKNAISDLDMNLLLKPENSNMPDPSVNCSDKDKGK